MELKKARRQLTATKDKMLCSSDIRLQERGNTKPRKCAKRIYAENDGKARKEQRGAKETQVKKENEFEKI